MDKIIHLFSPPDECLRKTYNTVERYMTPEKAQQSFTFLLENPQVYSLEQTRLVIDAVNDIYHHFTCRLTYDQQGDIADNYPTIIDTMVDLEELTEYLETADPDERFSRQWILDAISDSNDKIDILARMVRDRIPCPRDPDMPLYTDIDDEY